MNQIRALGERGGSRINLAELLEQAAACPPPSEVFDTADATPSLTPGDMPGRIAAWYRSAWSEMRRPRGGRNGEGRHREPRRRASPTVVEAASLLFGHPRTKTVHIDGWRAPQNRLLCQLRRRPGRRSSDRRPRRSDRYRQYANSGAHAWTSGPADLRSVACQPNRCGSGRSVCTAWIVAQGPGPRRLGLIRLEGFDMKRQLPKVADLAPVDAVQEATVQRARSGGSRGR